MDEYECGWWDAECEWYEGFNHPVSFWSLRDDGVSLDYIDGYLDFWERR